MQKNGNYTDDELKAIQSDFTKLIPDMAQKLNKLKGVRSSLLSSY